MTWSWALHLWTVLYLHFSQCLDKFKDLDILPIGNESSFSLSRLTSPSILVLKKWKDLMLTDDIEEFINKLGVKVVHELPEEVFKHPLVVGTYVKEPSSKAILNAMINAGVHLKDTTSMEMDKTQSTEFISLISQYPDVFSKDEKSLLTSLKIFNVQYPFENDCLGSIQEVNSVACKIRLPVRFCSSILTPTTTDEQQLVLRLGAVKLHYAEMVNQTLENMTKDDTIYSEREIQETMLFLLPQFQKNKEIRWNVVQSIGFIPCSEGSMAVLKKPSDLFDPTDRILIDLFVGEDIFPHQEFAAHVPTLKDLGLKTTEHITSEDLLRAALAIECKVKHLSDEVLQVKSDALINQIASMSDISQDLLSQFRTIKFLRKAAKPRHISSHFDWFEDTQVFYNPTSVVTEALDWLYGSVLPVIKIPDNLSEEKKQFLQTQLQFITCPPLKLIIKQLKITIKCCNIQGHELYIKPVKRLYEHLSTYNNKDIILAFEHQDMVSGKWLWTGETFTCPRDVYLTYQEQDVTLKPFKYLFPEDLCNLKSLLPSFGSVYSQDKTMYFEVLQRIKLSMERGETDRRQQYLQTVLSILQTLVRDNNANLVEDDFDKMLLPIQAEGDDFQLKPWRQCVNTEAEPCVLDGNIAESDDQLYYLHKAVPQHLSGALNVPSLMDKLLGTKEIDLNFGQQESLTKRLKDLTNQYTDGMAIVKELIQNADDAKASRICFLYDERENLNARKGLLHRNLSEFQGPALWTFNDAEFTDSDFQNIATISGATKEDDTTKIGRFGLGFNAVYNLTDLPSLISRDNFVIFDPHKVNLQKPGMRFNIKKNKGMMKSLADQFQPFQGVFGWDLSIDRSQTSKGTLFRFPLRTHKQASCSEIRPVEYTRKEMIALIELCLGSLGDLLLFTQHVTEFQFYYLRKEERDASNKTLLFKASKILSESVILPPIHPTPMEEIKKRYDNKQDETRLPQAITISTLINKDTCVEMGLPSTESSRTVWLTNWSTGQHKAREFIDKHQTIKGILPIATVAVPLDLEESPHKIAPLKDNPSGFSQISIVYNFLPMPIKTKLPVIINGCFVVSSDRQRLLEKSSDEKHNTGSEWNEVLLQDSVATAYVGMLQSLTELTTCNTDVFNFWPREENCEVMLQPLLQGFYSTVVLSQPQILPGLDTTWASFDCSMFLDDIFQPSDIRQKAFGVLQTALTLPGKTVVDMPTPILNLFPKEDIEAQTIFASKFYQDLFLPKMNEIDNNSCDSLVLFALKSQPELLNILKDTPCIPVCNTQNKRRCPSGLIHPEGKVAELYDPADGRFPSETFRDSLVLERLCDLGMLKDFLPNKEIADRANSIVSLSASDEKKARERFYLLLEILKIPCQVRTFSLEEKSSIVHIPFIPVLQRPNDWPDSLSWKGDNMHWGCPGDVHNFKSRHLVGCERLVCEALQWEKKKMLSEMGMCDAPSPNEVITQLQHLSEAQKPCEQWLKIQDIYEAIYKFIETDSETQTWTTQLANIKHIFVYGRPVEARQIQFSNTRYNCQPYLFNLPNNYLKYRNTMNLFGVKESFSVDDIRNCLNNFFSKFQDNHIQDNDIDVLNCILQLLVQTSKQSESEINWNEEDILLPDQSGTLYPCSMLCFNDCPWMSDSTDMLYIHTRFSKEVADVLGVKTSQSWCAADNSEGFAVPFGQKEELTTRLRGLLNGYPCDEAIFKELVQNADDAGATKIMFIKDLRQHKTEKVLCDNWKCLQGPALCVYNDKPFSEKDLKGIQSLGEGSKSEDELKTGKYGVGFNTVYHITDVPSFITQSGGEEIFCVFDPNRKYVPNMTPDLSGMRYNKLEKTRKRFPDVFSCYPQQLLEETGTLFRFPLRSEEMANKSDIKKEEFTEENLQKLLSKFQQEAKDCLLFLKTVRTIQFTKILDDGKIVSEFEVNAVVNPIESRQNYIHELQKVANSCKLHGKLQDIEPQTFTSVLNIEEIREGNITHEAQWYIEQHIGFKHVNELPDHLLGSFNSGRVGCLPTACIAFPFQPVINQDYKAFRHLPLPIITGLPVAVDAHFILDHENRRSIYTSQNQDSSAMWNLNIVENMLAPLYASALLNLKSHLTKFTIETYYNYFPDFQKTSDFWKKLSLSTYKCLDTNSSPVLGTCKNESNKEIIQRWLPVTGDDDQKAYFNTLSEENRATRRYCNALANTVPEDKLTDIIKRLGFNLVDAPHWILLNFREAGIEASEVTPTAVIRHLRGNCAAVNIEKGPANIQETSFKSKTSLLKLLTYCNSSEDMKDLEQLPIRLTCDQRLHVFQNSNPVYFSKYHLICKKSSDRFLDVDVGKNVKIIEARLQKHPQVLPLLIRDLNSLLSLEIDSQFLTGQPVEWNPPCVGLPSISHLREIWQYLREQTESGVPPMGITRWLSQWPLIPVKRLFHRDISKLLAPISYSNQIIYESTHEDIVKEQLKAQGMLILDIDHLSAPSKTFVESLVISISDVPALLRGIIALIKTRPQCISYNHIEQFSEILPYFARSTSIQVLQGYKHLFRTLPFFETVSDTAVNLLNCSAEVLCNSVPQNGVDKVVRKYQVVLLKYNEKLIQFYEHLDVKYQTDMEFYCKYMFDTFNELDEGDRMVHLEFLKSTLIHRYRDDSLIAALQQFAFIPHNGVLKTANYFYDHFHPLLKTLMDRKSFVPEPFREKEWYKLLQLSGLIRTVNPDLLVRLSSELEEEGSKITSNTETVASKSKVLVKYLFEHLHEAKNSQTAERVSRIKFLVSNSGTARLQKYGSSLQDGIHMICFQGSFNPEHTKLVWTTSDILPEYAHCQSGYCKALNVPEEPSVSLVEKNLLSVIRSVQSNNTLQTNKDNKEIEILTEIFQTHYSFFQNSQPSQSDLKQLTNSQCILIPEHRCLKTPNMVVQSLREKNLKPYLVSQPMEFGPFSQLFRTLGVAEEDSIRHYANVLRIINDRAGDNILHPNEMKVVLEALKAIKDTLTEGNVSEDLSNDISELFLPVQRSNGQLLVISTEVVIIDKHTDLDLKCNVLANLEGFIDPLVLYGLLPQKHRPSLFSELWVQELTDDCKAKLCKTPTSCRLQEAVRSEELLNGVVRLLKHNNIDSEQTLDDSLKTVERHFCSINLFSVPVIETHLKHNGEVVPDSCSRGGNSFSTRCKDSSDIHIVFAAHILERTDNLTIVSTVLGESLPTIPGMSSVFLRFSTLLQKVFSRESVQDYLDQGGIRTFSDHKKVKPLLPPAGTFIPLDQHDLLDASFTFFEKDEYVGYEVFDPLYDDEEGEPAFVYAIILDVIETSECRWSWQRQYKVNLGEDIKVVSATDLYKLHRTENRVELDVEVYTGQTNNFPNPTSSDKTLREVRKEIYEMLKVAWENDMQKNKVFKRLLLTWHPDKNVGNEIFCTKVTQYIMMLIEQFKSGNFDDIESNDDDYGSSDFQSANRRTYKSSQRGSAGGFSFDDDDYGFSDFQSAWFQRNTGFYSNFFKRSNRRAYESSQRGSAGGFYFDSTDGGYHSTYKSRPNPQPSEGRRWLRQAQVDFQSISCDTTPCWKSFKCQQVVEKALKALVYSSDANNSVVRSHNLRVIACHACPSNSVIYDRVNSLLELLGARCYLSTRYPDAVGGAQIPDEAYTHNHATKAHELCTEILNNVKHLLSL